MASMGDKPDETLRKGPINLPMVWDESEVSIDWKLPTWQHVKWTLHALSPIFTLSLDSLPSISNAVKIYCLWLKNPKLRPAAVTPAYEEEFVTTILLDLSELFVVRKLSDNKSVSLASAKRHSELCNTVIKTIISDFIPTSSLLQEPASSMWRTLTGFVLGISDDLLWRDGANYLADDLTDSLLTACFYCLLKCQIYDLHLWKKASECFRLWCHRVKAVLVWGNVVIGLTKAVRSIIHHQSSGEQELTIGVHSVLNLTVNNEYVLFTWSKITKLLPKMSAMTADIYLRSAQTLEKLIEIWLADDSVPDLNSLFTLYGDYIFDACMVEKAGYDTGRSIVLRMLCKMLSCWQYRTVPEERFLIISYATLQKALTTEGDVLSAVILNVEPVLTSNQPGVRCLVLPLFMACRKIVRRYLASKSSSQDGLRLCCYRILSLIGVHFNCEVLDRTDFEGNDSLNGLYSSKIYSVASYGNSAKNLQFMILDTLASSLSAEDSMRNVRFLLNVMTSFASDADVPLASVIVKIFEESLYQERWVNETLLTTVRCMEQLAKIQNYDAELIKRVCLSLMTQAESLYSRNPLPSIYYLLIAIFECSFAWLSIEGQFHIDCLSATLTTMIKIANGLHNKGETKSRKSAVIDASATYNIKSRKSLANRVFTTDTGVEDNRPRTLSPSLQKGVDEIVSEYLDSSVQKIMGLLLKNQLYSPHVTKIDTIDESKLTYFTLSATIVIGVGEDVIVLRNAADRYVWKTAFQDATATLTNRSEYGPESTSIDLEFDFKAEAFARPLVVIEGGQEDSDVLLNNENWLGSLENNPEKSESISAIMKEANSHLRNMLDEAPRKALLMSADANMKHNPVKSLCTLFTHLGLTLPATRALLMPLREPQADLVKLDSMSVLETISVPVIFKSSKDSDNNVSQSYMDFVKSLGSFEADASDPFYVDGAVNVNFTLTKSDVVRDASVAVIWAEDAENVSTLPQKLPVDSSAFVYLTIAPLAVGNGSKGHFYQVRILLSKTAPAESEAFAKYSNIFGPIVDGMIVDRHCLGRLVRETAISAHQFILRFILNKPTP